jgi:hypothetical protein
MVDDTPPEVARDTWTLKKGGTDEIVAGELPSSVLHCVDVDFIIEEPEKLLEEEIELRWQFLSDPSTGLTWPVYGQAFGNGPLASSITLVKGVGEYYATAECVDLWPDPVDPPSAQMTGVKVILWVHGTDSAGSSLFGGGPTAEGNIVPIQSQDPDHRSQYDLIHEEAVFSVATVRYDPATPEVGESMTIEVLVQNVGSLAGSADLRVMSVMSGMVPVRETVHTTSAIDIAGSSWESISLEAFTTPTTGMYYLIYDDASGELLYNGSQLDGYLNVKVQSDEGDGSALVLLLVGLLGVVAVLATLVMVLLRRGNDGPSMDYDDDDDDYDDGSKAIVDLPAAPPAASVSPEMARAMETFPQWTQDQIQGYFDQGWDIESLLEWVNSQE